MLHRVWWYVLAVSLMWRLQQNTFPGLAVNDWGETAREGEGGRGFFFWRFAAWAERTLALTLTCLVPNFLVRPNRRGGRDGETEGVVHSEC